jgi:hypothetical protein
MKGRRDGNQPPLSVTHSLSLQFRDGVTDRCNTLQTSSFCPQTSKMESPTCKLEPPIFNVAAKRWNSASKTRKLECFRCKAPPKRRNLEPKSFAGPPQRFNVASQTLTRACWRYPSPPLRYPHGVFWMEKSGKNVRFFGSKVQDRIFRLEISVFETKKSISNMQHRISKIQRCMLEVRRCQFEVGGRGSEVPRGVLRTLRVTIEKGRERGACQA